MCAVVYAFTSKIHSENNSMKRGMERGGKIKVKNYALILLYIVFVCEREREREKEKKRRLSEMQV